MNYVVTKPVKSKGIAALLVILFGPLGLFYSSIVGALVMVFIAPLVIFLSVLYVGSFSSLIPLIFYGVFIYYLLCFTWALLSVDSYNRRIMDEQTFYNTYYNNNQPSASETFSSAKEVHKELEILEDLYNKNILNEENYTKKKQALIDKINNNNSSIQHYENEYPQNEFITPQNSKIGWLIATVVTILAVIFILVYNKKDEKINFSQESIFNDTPTEEMAKEKIEKEMNMRTKKLIQIVEFQKTNGIKQNYFGQDVYKIEYTMKLKFKDDAYRFEALGKGLNFDTKSSMNKDQKSAYKFYKKGSVIEHIDNVTFEKTENGWR